MLIEDGHATMYDEMLNFEEEILYNIHTIIHSNYVETSANTTYIVLVLKVDK